MTVTVRPAQKIIDDGFLPDFCRGEIVFHVVVLAELLAVVISVVSARIFINPFTDLLIISIFVQWVALTSVLILCLTRKYLNRLPRERAIILAYLLLVLTAGVLGEIMTWVGWLMGMTTSIRPDWYLKFQIQNLTVSAIVDALALRYFLGQHLLKQRALGEARANMELQKYRIRPHFLFNSMNIIASLTRRAPAKAEAAIEDMADLFRLMLDESKSLVPLRNEIAVAKKYLKLERLRLEKRLKATWDVGDVPQAAKIPVLMLQLLLENAIHYGIEPREDGGEIGIHIHADNDTLRLRVVNPASTSAKEGPQGDSAAFVNIRERLRGHFGAAASLAMQEADGVFAVDISLPASGGFE